MRKHRQSPRERFEDRVRMEGWFAYVPKDSIHPDPKKRSIGFKPHCLMRDWKELPLSGLFSSIERGGLRLDIAMNDPDEWTQLEETLGREWWCSPDRLILLSDGSALEFESATIEFGWRSDGPKAPGFLIVRTDIHPNAHLKKLRRRINDLLAKNLHLTVTVARHLEMEER